MGAVGEGKEGIWGEEGEKGVGSRVNGERGATGPRGEEVGEKTREGAQEEEGMR